MDYMVLGGVLCLTLSVVFNFYIFKQYKTEKNLMTPTEELLIQIHDNAIDQTTQQEEILMDISTNLAVVARVMREMRMDLQDVAARAEDPLNLN